MNITILGAGAYGLALSSMFLENNCNITVWTKSIEEVKQLKKDKCNKKVLPDYVISDKIIITDVKHEIFARVYCEGDINKLTKDELILYKYWLEQINFNKENRFSDFLVDVLGFDKFQGKFKFSLVQEQNETRYSVAVIFCITDHDYFIIILICHQNKCLFEQF